MDRLFLDANVLFSAAYTPHAGLLKFWKLPRVALCSSHYALEEARVNLGAETQRARLSELAAQLQLFDPAERELLSDHALPAKDIPIPLGAIAAKATHLITGDLRHFGQHFGKELSGILILTPADYFRNLR